MFSIPDRLLQTVPLSLGAAVLLAAGCGDGEPSDYSTRPADTPSDTVEGNPTCADLGLEGFSYKIDPPESGTFDLDAYNQVTVEIDGATFDWAATIGIDAVIVKGGPRASVYDYAPEATADQGLHAPINDNNGTPFGLSHIDFCFDYEVVVTKTANTSFTRDWDWSIEKSGNATELLLASGQQYEVEYTVIVTAEGHTDGDWAVSGTIAVFNPAPVAALVTGVTDSLAGADLPVDCGTTFPVTLAPGETLECTYATELSDGSSLTNTAAAATEGAVGSGEASAPVDFSGAEVTELDGCVAVSDDPYGALGTVCAAGGSATYTYSLLVGYESCGEFEHVNVASYSSDDGESGTDSWTVAVTIDCVTGCSLTPGYWKTHSEYGPAPYDDTWAQLEAGADTAFFLSGSSWYGVLWTRAGSNAYYILARAYIAAYLNRLNGADTSSVETELAATEALFAEYTPSQIGALRGGDPVRAGFLALATTLDDYNNGLVGPPHCSEDESSEAE